MAALSGFVRPSGGRVLVNGVDVSDVDRNALRAVVCGALSDAHVFHTTLRANLTFAKPGAKTTDLDRIAALVRLDTWLSTLPDDWDTVVGDDGQALSGGQRQRLVLARALLADAPVLLLDEPVEGLDPVHADKVLYAVLDATTGQTVVLATHRLAVLPVFDEILVLDGERIGQRGTHRDLATRPGYYRDRWEAERLTEFALPAPADSPE